MKSVLYNSQNGEKGVADVSQNRECPKNSRGDSINLSNSIKQTSYKEAISRSGTQEIPRVLWNLKFHYHVQKNSALMLSFLSMNPVHPAFILDPF
jgi:hypothetical protein